MWNWINSTLNTGFNLSTSFFDPRPAVDWVSSFFPTAQKREIKGDEVSATPGGSTAGYRSTTKDATTLGDTFKSWWNNVSTFGRQLGDTFRTSIMGYKKEAIENQFKSTVEKVATPIFERLTTFLPDYFMQKWGLVDRVNTGEKTGNTPYQPPYVILHQNETQSSAPATQPNMLDNLFAFIAGSQPKGAYNIGMPQSAAIPTNTFVTERVSTQQAAQPGINPLIFIGIGALVLVFFFMRRK